MDTFKHTKTLQLVFLLFAVWSCDRYAFVPPDCPVITDRVETPTDWQLANWPYIDLTVNGGQSYILLDKMANGIESNSCPQFGPECLQANTHYYEDLIQINISRPHSFEDLQNYVDVVTPLLSLDSLKSKVFEVAHMGVTLYNSCGRSFEPIALKAPNIYNMITKVELVESNVYESNGLEYYIHEALVYGELKAEFDALGETVIVTANYKLREYMNEVK